MYTEKRTAIISDIHGNIHALNAIIENIDKQNVKRVICLGDVEGYGPNPITCRELTNLIADVEIEGNHCYGVHGPESIEEVKRSEWRVSVKASWIYARTLFNDLSITHESIRYKTVAAHIETGFAYVHGAPQGTRAQSRNTYVRENNEIKKIMKQLEKRNNIIKRIGASEPIVNGWCAGHTHQRMFGIKKNGNFGIAKQHQLAPGPKYCVSERIMKWGKKDQVFINPGSVGQPRDNDPRASYAILEGRTATFISVPYNVTAAVEAQKAVEKDYLSIAKSMMRGYMPPSVREDIELFALRLRKGK